MSQPAVLIVEDDPALREALIETLADSEHPVLAAGDGAEALGILNAENVGLVVSDLQMQPMNGRELLARMRDEHPGTPAVLMTAYGTIENAVREIRRGASDYLVKPFEAEALQDVVKRHFRASPDSHQPIAEDPVARRLLGITQRVAASDVTVMLSGESGSGKEIYARYIHHESPRSAFPFVAINCAAIPDNMLEAVLFGYEKGAFTGAATSHPGKFEQAQRGTLLLDEISEMDLGLQAKLLRVLQEREVERIGGRGMIPLDVRVLATTNRDLRNYVADNQFREDLYYRLSVFPLHIPALRDRPGDVLPLAEALLRKNALPGNATPTLAQDAREALLAYSWPGNVRELENLVQRSLVLFRGDELTAADLVFEHAPLTETGTLTTAKHESDAAVLQDDLKQREFQLVADALSAVQGNRKAAAEKLGISPRTLRYKLAKMRDEGYWNNRDDDVPVRAQTHFAKESRV